MVRPDGQTVEFLYDPLGRRVAKTFAGRTTRWVWDGNLPLHEWQEETGIVLDVEPPPAYEMDARLAEVLQLLRDKTLSPLSPQGPPPRANAEQPITWLFEPDSFAPLARLQGERRESIVCDHLGTPLAMFNDAGDQTWSLDLDIYGQPRMVEGERSLCPFRYPGQCEDSETGLYYNRFRYFDPEADGYFSQDPIGLAGGNPTLYGYVGDPNTWVDWLGLGKCPPKAAQKKRKPRTPPDKARARGVRRAWAAEKKLVKAGKPGTRQWTRKEKAELLKKGKVKGYEGHHINNVHTNSKLADNPDNNKIVKGRSEHLAEHGGDFKNPTAGPFIVRSQM